MNKRFATLALILSCIFCVNVWAGPAAPIEVVLSQPDGTTFIAIARGDEFANWIETSEGHSIVNDKGTWYYAERDNAGELRATSNRVGSLSRVELESMPLHVAPTPDLQAFAPRTIRKIPRNKSDTKQQMPLSQSLPHSQYVLTVLVDYSDISFTYSDSSFKSLVYGTSGSVKDFFLDNSYGRFTIAAPTESYGTSNDGIIHVVRTTTHPNPGSNRDLSREEAREIVGLTDAFINYATYDTNADGTVSPDELSILIILAGYEASYGGMDSALTPNVWPHQWSFTSSLTLDGVELQPYTMVGEAHATSQANKHQATIGIMCHELGHLMLGLPDLYDTDDSSEGIGKWGIMGNGGWNQTGAWSGDSPAHMSAWSKVATNFAIPQDISTDQSGVSIAKADTNEAAKRIWVDKYKLKEYFLVENRQKSGYDAGLPGSGLLIWHIDENLTDNSDENHKLVDVEEADGQRHLDFKTNRGDTGDPFPGSSNNTNFDNTTTPNSKDDSGNATQIGVTGISASSATMTANITTFNGGGDHVSYFALGGRWNRGYGSTTIWAGIRALNDTVHTKFDGVDVYVADEVGATIDISYYSSMTGGTPSGLLHSQTGFAAGPGWNRLLLTTPQSFPIGAERGVVLKIVNNSYTFPASYVPSSIGSGRSYIDSNGAGTFYQFTCPDVCGDLNLAALVSGTESTSAADLAITILDAVDGTYAPGDILHVIAKTENISGTTAGSYRITFYASRDTSISSTDHSLGYSDLGSLAAGENHYYDFSMPPLSNSLSSGQYYVGAILSINDANSSNNTKYDTTPITVGGSSTQADLAITILDAQNGTYAHEDKLVVEIKTENVGGTASDSFRLNLYASTNTIINPEDYYLGYFDYDALGVGETSHYNITWSTPFKSIPDGNYYIGGILDIDDADNSNNSKYDPTPVTVASISVTVPDAPTLTSVIPGDGKATLHFTANGNGGSAITGYTAKCAAFTQAGASSPITVSGLKNGFTYSCSVVATNAIGNSMSSSALSVTPFTDSPPFQINAGLNGSWYNPATNGQGFFIEILPDLRLMSIAWFTYETERPDESVPSNLGDAGHRWMTALGSYEDDTAALNIEITKGGVFDQSPPLTTGHSGGTIIFKFNDCKTGTLTYDIPSIGRKNTISLQRIAFDNVALCESLEGSQ